MSGQKPEPPKQIAEWLWMLADLLDAEAIRIRTLEACSGCFEGAFSSIQTQAARARAEANRIWEDA